ncbi:MAG: glycosyltransferase [Eubacterium sp.]|nr:glycosyltransferase [Eubacterium sp.]
MIEKICEDSLISIIMPAYNAEDFLDETIQSVLKQTYQKWELVVVNDASQDSTLQILERYMALDSRIKVYSLTKNSGACVALNEALKRTSGEYICWLSADDKYKKEMLESSLHFLHKHKNFQAVFSRHEFIDEDSELIEEWKPIPEFYKIGMAGCMEPYRTLVFCGNAFNACTVLATSETIEKAGFFDENHRYAGDYHYMMRVAAYADLGFLDKVNVQSRIHSKQVTNEGKNSVDAVNAYADIVYLDDVRKRLYVKAGIKDTREEILSTFENRQYLYGVAGCEQERTTVEKRKEEFLKTYPSIIEADFYCRQISELINSNKWDRAEEMIQTMEEDKKAFINKEKWGILVACILEYRGDYAGERDIIQNILEFNHSNYEAHYMLGNVCEKTDDILGALESYTNSVLYSKEEKEDFKLLKDNLKRFINEKV